MRVRVALGRSTEHLAAPLGAHTARPDLSARHSPVAGVESTRPTSRQDHDLEIAWSVNALDPLELDVGGRGWTRDERDRSCRVEPVDRLGHAGDDLISADDADVAV